MNITKRTKSEGTTVYQFRVFLSQSADGKQRTRSKTWQPPAGMTAKAAEKEAKRQAVIFENEVKQGRAALDAKMCIRDSFCTVLEVKDGKIIWPFFEYHPELWECHPEWWPVKKPGNNP